MRTAVFATLLGTLSLADCVYPTRAFAQGAQATDDATKVVRVVRVETRPVIDGRLDEAIWQQADVITDFHQIRPGNGTPPSERTEVYLLYDSDALYIGARMFDKGSQRFAFARDERHTIRFLVRHHHLWRMLNRWTLRVLVPTPLKAQVIAPGLLFSNATSSWTDFAATDGCTTSM